VTLEKIPGAADVIARLLSEEPVAERELERFIDHALACPACLEEVFAVAALATGGSEEWEKILNFPGFCSLCREHLPEYVEDDEAAARAKHPSIWMHLQKCASCREEEELLRQLLACEEAVGPPPLAGAAIEIPKSPSEPLVVRFARKIRVFWEGKRGRVSHVADFSRSGRDLALASFASRAWAPAYLAPEDAEIQELKWELPEGVSLKVTAATCGQKFNLTITPLRYGNHPRLFLKLFRVERRSSFLVFAGGVMEGNPCTLPGLGQGPYEVHLEAEGKRWEVPFELG
jgi:hypothetical protein